MQLSERRLAMMSRDDSEANWNRKADGQDHVFSQADALTKKAHIKMRAPMSDRMIQHFHRNAVFGISLIRFSCL